MNSMDKCPLKYNKNYLLRPVLAVWPLDVLLDCEHEERKDQVKHERLKSLSMKEL